MFSTSIGGSTPDRNPDGSAMSHEPFAEFALLLLVCALAGAVFVRLRQPVLIVYIVVGLKLDLDHIRHSGPVALATGLGQLAFTIAFGFLKGVGAQTAYDGAYQRHGAACRHEAAGCSLLSA